MDNFLRTYEKYQDSDRIETAVESGIPDELAAMLQQVDGDSYARGFFRFVSPDLFRDYLSLWNLAPADCFPFIKCAFGHLVFYHQEQYKALNPVYNEIDVLGARGELDFVMDYVLCDRGALENSFFVDIYEQAFDTLGPPELDQIYAFVPALGLGGSRNAANVYKVNLDEQMIILSQT